MRRGAAPALAALAWACCGPASADEGAGGAMPFARYGVGARALGMGGAFSAVASDVTATLWNPAGLANLDGFELGSQYAWMTLGRQFNYLSAVYAMPGVLAAGFSYLYFTTGDVEVRSGNTLDPEGLLRDREGLIVVSFAMPVHALVTAGANLKIYSQSFSGPGIEHAGSGIGGDLSVLVRHAPRWHSALVVLDPYTQVTWENRHADLLPVTIRAGTAVRALESAPHTLTAALDLEQNSWLQSPRPRLGVEYEWREIVSLRAGLAYVTPTFGVGVRRKFSFFSGRLDFSLAPDRMDEWAMRLSAIVSF